MDNGNILIYQNEKGDTKIDAFFNDSTIWMSQRSIAELYQTSAQNITLHIKNIYMEMENWRKIQLVSITYKFNKREIGKFKER